MKLGDLSAIYESNGDPATISTGWGDAGGVSYGTYQFASNVGVPEEFAAWLVRKGYDGAEALIGAGRSGRSLFDAAWLSLAAADAEGFGDMQHEFIKERYYDRAVRELRSAYFNIENHSEAMKQVVWSRAVQYGAGNIVEMFEEACSVMGHPNLSYVDSKDFDADLIKAIYLDVCSTPEWTNGSPALRDGLYNRFANECEDALSMLYVEVG